MKGVIPIDCFRSSGMRALGHRLLRLNSLQAMRQPVKSGVGAELMLSGQFEVQVEQPHSMAPFINNEATQRSSPCAVLSRAIFKAGDSLNLDE